MSARIVFDLDGTLIDSVPDIHLAVSLLLQEQGLAPLDIATVTSFIGNGLPHLAKLVMEQSGIAPAHHPKITARLMQHYDAVNGRLTSPYSGTLDALKALKTSGHRLAICTNKPEAPARTILERVGMTGFDSIIGGDTLSQRKPDPAPLHAAFEALGEGQMIYVGDSEVDAETAYRAAVPFFLFTEGYRKTPVVELPHRRSFSVFSDLPGLVDALLKEM
ncbi:phosphoglycolate phosphatase [Primorskyibacter sp. 2E107]|uniref:phosphoglycolate phosphatase n=1 Tax=Primorskyibacter sp. 2E107 TaxID=3403458 RepID=UPI003AF609C4